MSNYEEHLSAFLECFEEIKKSKELQDFADYHKKYNEFMAFYDDKFGDSENPEHEEVLQEMSDKYNQKREAIVQLFAEQAKDIPGLIEGGKLAEQVRSFVLIQVDDSIMVTPPKPLVPDSRKIEAFYQPIYEDSKNLKELTQTKLDLAPIEIQACALAGLDLSEYEHKDIKAIRAAWEDKGFIIENGNIFHKNDHTPIKKEEMKDAMRALLKRSHPDKHLENEAYYQSLFELVTTASDEVSTQQPYLENKNNKNTMLMVIPKTELTKYEERKKPEDTEEDSHKDLHWIDQKDLDYKKMKAAGNNYIKSIIPDKTAGTFTAEIDNGTITYTSPNEVSVTKDSSYKVFETMMREDSNAGKTIRIPDDASPEFKTNLFVAAVLNGHKVNGAENLELDEATLAKIGLTPEQKAQVLATLQKQDEPQPEKAPEENHVEEPKKEKTQKENQSTEKDEPLPGPYNPAQHRINHVLERKNMLNALAEGETENIKPQNPARPTYMMKNVPAYNKQGESR